VTGVFFNPTDPDSMSRAVEKVIESGPTVRELARRAKERALQRFHPRIVAEQHMKVYREIGLLRAGGSEK
jgi:glycosyltransferase involved in cell wall biosynthesis